MGRTKRSNKPTTQVDRYWTRKGTAKTNLEEDSKDVTENADQKIHETMPENGFTGEETKASKSLTARQKRKLPPQTEERDSQRRKRGQISSAAPAQVSANKTSTEKTLQNSPKQDCRYPMRSRDKKLLQNGSTAASSPDLKLKTSQEKEIKSEVESCSLDTSKGPKKLVGAHCSVAGGLHKAVEEAVAIGGRAFGLFLRSQRSWASKPLDPEAAEKFKSACKKHGFPPNSILPHGSYLMNCGSANPDTQKKSREALLDELQRCEALGLTLYNFHPGSTCGEISVDQCLDSIAEAINWAHQHTKFVITVVENMSCQGNTVGGRFEELKGIIDRVKDKSRIGVCLDTCHAFAAGFDLSTKEGFEKFVSDFDRIVGFQYLKAMHLNDSKGDVGCHLDRHENIGKGKIGLEGFRQVMTEPCFDGIPMILETPQGDYAEEIKILNRLI